MNICMKIGLGLKFSPTTVLQIKLSFVKKIQKLNIHFLFFGFFFLIMGLSLEGGGGYCLNKYFVWGPMVPQKQ